ncbi:MAG: hypothetical protein IJ457_08480 [Clostridia bacterium]|nr:hypothetical protein [Clostridia bacterium]
MTKRELEDIIAEEKMMYVKSNYSFHRFVRQRRYVIWKYLSCFRRAQYYKEQLAAAHGFHKLIMKLALRFSLRKKNILSERCAVEITNNSTIGRRLNIWHGGVVICGNLGDDVAVRGNSVIGNKELINSAGIPTVGNGVEIGFGAAVIGSITIAERCIIGANAVVTKSFLKPGTVIVGVPGKALEKGE